MKSKFFRLLMLAGALCLSGTLNRAMAQVNSGRIIGQVLDAKGASIAGAIVTVKNEGTSEQRTTTSNTDGTYQIVALRPSFYTINVTADQFALAEQTGLQLTVGQEIHRNFTMQLATLSSTISVVESVESAIDTSSARLGVNINQREVGGLPLNGRQLSQLYLQAPGSLNSGTGTFQDIRFSGRAVEQNAIRYDGIEGSAIIDAAPGNLNGEVPSPFRLQSSLENVQEFRVDSNNFPAEYGTGTGGQISVVTKSGSNAFHGGVFEYLRNDKLDARNDFDLASRKSTLRLNQFGGSLGGPVVKDKLFFFGYYEGYRLRAGINNIEAVPSATVRALPVCTSGQTPGPATCVVGAVQPLLAGFIGPGAVLLPGQSKDPNFDIYQLSGVSSVTENSAGLRLDYHISEKHTLFARYFRDQGTNDQPEGVTGRHSHIIAWPQNAILSLQSNLSSNVINEAKVGFNEALTRINGIAPTINGVDFSAITINISGSVANSGIAGQGSSSGIAIPGGLVRSNSATNGRGQPYTPYTLSFIDNVSWMAGNHNFKFGAEVRMVRLYTDRLGGTTYTFQNLTNFLGDTLQQVQYLGDVSAPSPFNNGVASNRYLKQQYYVGYAQDEVKLKPNLTLNYGLRYEYYSPLHEDRNLDVVFDIVSGVIKPSNSQWYHAESSGFGPRVGLTWSPLPSHGGMFGGDHTVFRGGFGIYYGPGQTEDLLQPAESDRISSTFGTGATLIQSPNTTPTPVAYPVVPSDVVTNFNNNPTNRSFQPRAYAPEYTVPERIYQYSASWQQQWGYQLVSTVAYVGSQGRNLFLRSVANKIVAVRTNTDPIKPAVVIRQFDIDNGGNSVLHPFAEVDYKTSGGHDSYNGLQASLVRRSNSGLTLSTQYTFSKSFGNTSGSNEALTAGNPNDFNYDVGYNNFDVRHTFNASALYALPVGHGRRVLGQAGGIAQAALGNWEVGTIVSARSGIPLNILVTRPDIVYVDGTGKVFGSPAAGLTAVINTPGGGASRGVRRPDLIPGVNPILPSGYINPAAFTTPKPGTFGNLERGSIHGPGATQVDFTLSKNFPIHESISLNFRAEIYNAFNHPIFNNPPVTLPNALSATFQPGQAFGTNAGSFGKFNQTVGTTVGLGTNRQIQFALRLSF